MPEGQHASLSLEEFTDLIEYLTTLKQTGAGLSTSDLPPIAKPVALRPFLSHDFTRPRGKQESGLTSFRQIPGQPSAFLLLHQTGVIWKVEKTVEGEKAEIFADLSLEVFSDRGPNGLLDVAFHPKFRENRKYYLFYQIFEEGKVVTRVVEKLFGSEQPERLILKVASVAEDDSGGCLAFGPDGFLYLVIGDTGPANDPNGHAQNMQLLLGKMLRLDVDRAESGLAYAIPADNPFRSEPSVRPEIWAAGLRNPWRFCFDRLNGDLWLADVGQNRCEEVDLIRRGGNHGWNVYEGFEPFSNQFRTAGRAFAQPLLAYRRKYGNSVTGGHVYRGDQASSFYGVYVCGDYNSKRLFGITQQGGALTAARTIGTIPQRLASFGEDEAGHLYAVGYEGMVYQVDFAEAEFNGIQRVEQSSFGKMEDGAEVKLITLRNERGMSAEIISYGAILKELRAPDRKGDFANVVLTTDSLEKYQRFGGPAAVIGRVANRIAGARFELDGAAYQLAANNGKNTIHGGVKGFSKVVWQVEAVPPKEHESAVKLTYLSKDGEEGFPGNLKTTVTYTLTDSNELQIAYEAETDKPTIVNLTNHAYFDLGGRGYCLDDVLWIATERYTPTDEALIPTGEIVPVTGTPMDFSQPTRIGDRIEQLRPMLTGYDHNFMLAGGGALKLAARLFSPSSGRVMEVRTTQPALQIYTANHLNHSAVCLETQHPADAIHHRNFPSIVLRPGEHFREQTTFAFTVK